MTLAHQPGLRNSVLAGVQAGVATAIALPLVLLSPWSHLVGFASLGALVALFGRFAPQLDRNRVLFLCAVCQVFAVCSMSAIAWVGAPVFLQLAALALFCGAFLFVVVNWGFGPPGALIFVFAAAASMGADLTFVQVMERTVATAAVAGLAWAICALTEVLRRNDPELFPVAAMLLPIRHLLAMSARATVGAAIAVFASHALGAHHPAWAAMGALAVLQGNQLHVNMNRALQRTVGTLVGAVLAWVLLVQAPSAAVIIGALVALQILTELVIGANYALGQVLVTPMALLMTPLAAPHSEGAAMAPERVLDTLLGAAVGICIAVLLSSVDDRRTLAKTQEKARKQ